MIRNTLIANLRINIKNLADESRNIKKEFRKHTDESIRNSLHLHRVIDVRKEARITQLALAAVRGVPYSILERNARIEPDWKKVLAKVDRHSATNDNYDIKQQVGTWLMDAKNYINSKST
jgi:hypothetical protein